MEKKKTCHFKKKRQNSQIILSAQRDTTVINLMQIGLANIMYDALVILKDATKRLILDISAKFVTFICVRLVQKKKKLS
jgi:hypothetical protein